MGHAKNGNHALDTSIANI